MSDNPVSDDRIERYVRLMTDYLPANQRPQGCAPALLERAAQQFRREFGSELPQACLRVLRVADGVDHNGLTLWPVNHRGLPFRQNLFEANRDLRDSFDEDLIYLAQLDEELYVYDTRSREYQAIEMVGLPVWEQFASAEEMFLFLLERAWGEAI
ncbi:hypothetical protein ACIP1T_28180 [Pseudomonas japonica]|uniref:hypothetical protein n=1 Tax=Pseudomonas TaxID=286 RepID=UPI002928A7CA|nr:hypothetical protein [Pseudomonas sp. zfem002]MDU9392021.1 hypothetical protein [Pseudomonas sp. zfem002]